LIFIVLKYKEKLDVRVRTTSTFTFIILHFAFFISKDVYSLNLFLNLNLS